MSKLVESYAVDAGFGFVRTTEQVARKEHECELCDRLIEKGELYQRMTDFHDETGFKTHCFHAWDCFDSTTFEPKPRPDSA